MEDFSVAKDTSKDLEAGKEGREYGIIVHENNLAPTPYMRPRRPRRP